MKYTLKRLGLNNPTELEMIDCSGCKTKIITKRLSINDTVNEWRDCFLTYGKTFDVDVNFKLYNAMSQRTLISSKSVAELFYEQGVRFTAVEDKE